MTRSGVLTKRLTTVSQTRPSISAMLGFWVIAWAGSLLFAALAVETYVKRRWPSRSTLGLGAVVGLSAILFCSRSLVSAPSSKAPFTVRRGCATTRWRYGSESCASGSVSRVLGGLAGAGLAMSSEVVGSNDD